MVEFIDTVSVACIVNHGERPRFTGPSDGSAILACSAFVILFSSLDGYEIRAECVTHLIGFHNDQKWLVSYAATYLLPEGVKQVVASDNQFDIHTFVENAPEQLPTDRGERVAKYYHLKGAHSPSL